MESLVTIESIKYEMDLISYLTKSIRKKGYEVKGLHQAENTMSKLENYIITEENKDEIFKRLGKMYNNLYSNYRQVCQAEENKDQRRMDYFDDSVNYNL